MHTTTFKDFIQAVFDHNMIENGLYIISIGNYCKVLSIRDFLSSTFEIRPDLYICQICIYYF